MRILLEFFLFLGIFFPMYHTYNVIFSLKKSKIKEFDNKRFITILIPCYNEAKIIKNTIEGLKQINYENYEGIFVNDGSTDNTFKNLNNILKLKSVNRTKKHNLNSKDIKKIYQSKLFPKIFVIDKINGGKSSALNTGINYSAYDYIVTLDADCILKKDALRIISQVFDDKMVVAASGIIQIMQSSNLNEDKETTYFKMNNLLKLQTIEYMKSCYCYKASLAKLNSLLVISGAFGIFTKDILLQVDGFSHVIGEDLDLTLKIQFKIQNTKKKIAYEPRAVCYTEGPEKFKDYIKQRKRWQQSFIEALFNYKSLIFKDTFKKTLPFFMIIDALFLGVLSSFIIMFFTIVIIYSIIIGAFESVLIYLIIYFVTHLIYNIAGLCIASYYGGYYQKRDIIRIIFTFLLDIIIYRLIIIYTIILGSVAYFTSEQSWDKVERSGRDYFIKTGRKI